VLSGVEAEAAAVLAGRLGPSGPAELRLVPPSGLAGDAFGTRAALLGRELVPGDYLVLGDGASGEPGERIVPIQVGPSEEFGWRERLALPPPADATGGAGGPAAPGSHPRATLGLALALALLFLAGLAASRGQGLRVLGR
jgi:hypothetical protein